MRKLGQLGAIIFAVASLSSAAQASPWVLQKGDVALSGRFDYQAATEEFLESGGSQPFPLRGRFRGTTFEIGARVGAFDGFEFEIDIPLKTVSYNADPVILLPTEAAGTDALDYYQENIIALDETTMGVGDIRVSGRWQLFRSSLAGALELRLKTPTGYKAPAGTFGRDPQSAEDFLTNVVSYVKPENVSDDVTLGDGQLDIGGAILLGWALPTRTFFRLDLGGDVRFGGAGDRVLGAFKLGQFVSDHILFVLGTSVDISVQKGDIIGVSVAAEDPTVPAADYGGTTNLVLREVRLDHDAYVINGGVIVRVTDQVEATIEYNRIIHGRNISAVQGLSFGMSVRFGADR